MTNTRTRLAWDYSALAESYEHRADYAAPAIQQVVNQVMTSRPLRHALDVGAGTGKLTRPLLSAGFQVLAVEPNAAMRRAATLHAANLRATWIAARAEALPLRDAQYEVVCFGSSFNVVSAGLALKEASRVLVDGGLLALMWNHRNLDDPLQAAIESGIRLELPKFEYGSRRTDPTESVMMSGHFQLIEHGRHPFVHRTGHENFIAGWRSHATLARAAGGAFERVVSRISAVVPKGSIEVPFSTAVWLYRKRTDAR